MMLFDLIDVSETKPIKSATSIVQNFTTFFEDGENIWGLTGTNN